MPESKILTDNYSYWELDQYFQPYDLVVIGSGIVGLSTAISFAEKNAAARILVLERGFLPDGASTKNAGFACFGSPGEILADLRTIEEQTVWETFEMRYLGLGRLISRIGQKEMDYHRYGGFEIFSSHEALQKCRESLPYLNQRAAEITGKKDCFAVADHRKFGFRQVAGVLVNKLEGQINTGLMMKNLIRLARAKGIIILNNAEVTSITEEPDCALVNTNRGTFKSGQVVVAVNGFASTLLNIPDVLPARAQVLITAPVPGLKVRGTFHFDEGYYYFRNIHGRLLLGGGRNADMEGEQTTQAGLTDLIQGKLEQYLHEMILPRQKVQIERRWSGIMGVGSEKKPVIRQVSPHVVAAVRMGGMGVAIGSLVGEKAAELVSR